jgi:hypothetical protein
MGGPYATRRTLRVAKRLYPLMLAAYHRWDQLTPKQKEQYKRQAKRYAEQGAGYARQAAGSARQAASKLPTDRLRPPGGRFRRGR